MTPSSSGVHWRSDKTNDQEIQPDDIAFGSGDTISEIADENITLREYTRRIVNNYLKKYDNNMKLVAEKLDIGLSTIYRMLKEDQDERVNVE